MTVALHPSQSCLGQVCGVCGERPADFNLSEETIISAIITADRIIVVASPFRCFKCLDDGKEDRCYDGIF